jgi:opacity protein-like surface antigen
MKKKSLIIPVFILLILIPYGFAQAEEQELRVEDTESNWYIGISAGPQWRADAKDEKGETTFETGYAVNGFIGHRFNNFRVEGEVFYMVNNNDTTDPAGPQIGEEDSSGDVDFYGFFANVYYDFPIKNTKFKPYLGGGLGGHKVSINGLTTATLRNLPPEFGGPVVVYADSDWAFAYQLRVGSSYVLSQKTEVFLGYRYLNGSKLEFNLSDGSSIHPDVEVHSLEAGFRVNF